MVINVKHGRASESRDGRDSVRCRPARRAVTPAALFFAAMLAAAFGCRRGEPQAAESSPQEQPAEATPKVTQYPDEIYGDREIFKEPRIQFVWSPSEDDRRTIWSMKLDGSDVRQAVGRALLFSGDAKVLANYVVPVRSPDGRYIACAGKDGNGDEFRFLVDLKEKKVRTMMKAGSAADYNWTPDSRRVIFYGDLSLHQYEVPTGKLSEFPMIPSEGLHLVDQGRRFVAVEDKTITYYDASGKRLKRVPLPFTADRHHAVSPDGRRLALTVGTGRLQRRTPPHSQTPPTPKKPS